MHLSLRRALTLFAVVASGCGGTPSEPDVGPSDGGLDGSIDAPEPIDAADVDAYVTPAPTAMLDAANAVPEGHPLFEGQQRFLWDAWGVEVFDAWPPTEWMLALMLRDPEVFGNQFEAFGFVPDPNDDFPVGFKRGLEDPTRLHQTCALCHVGRLPNGDLWLGMPNDTLDFPRFREAVNQRWVADGHPPLTSAVESSKSNEYGPGRFAAETSEYPVAVPADFPPYWRLGSRTHLNYLGTGGNARTEIALAIFTFGAGAPNARTARVPFPSPARLDPFVAFMSAIEPPPAPAGNAATIAAGRAVFERERCTSCHHDDISQNGVTPYDTATDGRDRVPGDDPMFPEGSIHTSYLHRILIDGEPDAGITSAPADAGRQDDGRADLLRFIIANGLSVRLSSGYRATPLVGLWATAPYLHNGSVPTLEDLLRPASERPAMFQRGIFTVDTSIIGNRNGGHEFGTTISATDRAALVAYLQSL